jgi:hypothetical protein
MPRPLQGRRLGFVGEKCCSRDRGGHNYRLGANMFINVAYNWDHIGTVSFAPAVLTRIFFEADSSNDSDSVCSESVLAAASV